MENTPEAPPSPVPLSEEAVAAALKGAPAAYERYVADSRKHAGAPSAEAIRQLCADDPVMRRLHDLYPLQFYQPQNYQLGYYDASQPRILGSGGNRSSKSMLLFLREFRRFFGAAQHLVSGIDLGHPRVPPMSKTPAGQVVLWIVVQSSKNIRVAWRNYISLFISPPSKFIFPYKKTTSQGFPDIIEFYPPNKNHKCVGEPWGILEFKTMDQGVERLAGDTVSGLLIDEPPKDIVVEGDRFVSPIWDELKARTYDTEGATIAMAATFKNFIEVMWAHQTWKIPAQTDPEIGIYELSMLDNTFIPNSSKRRALREFSGWQQKVRVYGNLDFLPSDASSFFLTTHVENAVNRGAANPVWEGDAAPDASLIQAAEGPLKIWQQPIEKHAYVIGVDVAFNSPGGSFSAAAVLDRNSKKFVAFWRGRINPHEFANNLVSIAKHYNSAWLNVEAFGAPGKVTIQALQTVPEGKNDPLYLNLCRQRTRDGSINAAFKNEPGFATSGASRGILLNSLAKYLASPNAAIPSPIAAAELRSFIWRDSKFKAAKGAHDDSVFAMALATVTIGEFLPNNISPETTAPEIEIKTTSLRDRILRNQQRSQNDDALDQDGILSL